MARKKLNKPKKTNTKRGAKRERETLPWKFALLTIICILFLVVGFFGAARQHFASMDYGIKNSKLRKQIDDMKQEKRRLLLEKEVALSPFEIKKSAEKIGFRERSLEDIEIVKVRKTPVEKSAIIKTVDSKPVKTLLSVKENPLKKIIKAESDSKLMSKIADKDAKKNGTKKTAK